MGYLPIFMQLAQARCIVVGGGEVALRKVQSLLDAGAEVTVVSPVLIPTLQEHAGAGRICHISRSYAQGDMRGHLLVFAATDDAIVHKALYEEARALSLPINVVDQPELCTFIMPAVIRRGALSIAVSTGGASPAMAKRIAHRIGRMFGPEYGVALEILRAARTRLRGDEPSAMRRASALSSLAASRLPALVRRGETEGIERVLRRHLGAGLEELGLAGLQSGDTLAAG